VVSPLLANLYLHYAFDKWLEGKFSQCPFERYADDAIIHCRTEEEAVMVIEALRSRLKECGLELHPEKTKIVYCKTSGSKRSAKEIKFDFLADRDFNFADGLFAFRNFLYTQYIY
jgi:retron-type reverse transcriptase